jgi:D-alanyl-lipoteichoic acid acyltransferase DltB (MBOAT superfamily)
LANIGLLAVFKYFNFANANLHALADFLHWNYPVRNLGMVLPIGLSFHTFQSMAYTIEVYRGRQHAERHLGIYSLYVLFYPQLVAGPIERPQHLLHQFRQEHAFEADRVFDGLKQMLWGFFKKVVIADGLGMIVDAIYNNPSQYGGGYVIVATWFFAIQIYCDFSGYSDIAIGAARVLGFRLMTNFDRPYFAQSVADFWRRWHISLSTWFRDYLYIPLGGSRVKLPRWCFNVMVVFLISGMWHGASWTFAVWGGLHGIFLIASRFTQRWRMEMTGGPQPAEGVPRKAVTNRTFQPGSASGYESPTPRTTAAMSLLPIWRAFVTFNLVSFAWIFFRALTLADAGEILRRIFAHPFWLSPTTKAGGLPLFTASSLNISFALIAFLFFAEWMQSHSYDARVLNSKPVWIRWPVYYSLGLLILWIGALGGKSFIYFQF